MMANPIKTIAYEELQMPQDDDRIIEKIVEKLNSGELIITVRNISFEYMLNRYNQSQEYNSVVKVTGCDLMGNLENIIFTKSMIHIPMMYLEVSTVTQPLFIVNYMIYNSRLKKLIGWLEFKF